jgi:hypothetical protein
MNTQRRMDVLAELNAMAWDTLTEWMGRWRGGDGNDYKVAWQEDGTARVEINTDDGPESLHVQVEITVSVVPNRPSNPATAEPRAWGAIPAGWFVRDPKGMWWEITASERAGDKQRVSLRMASGETATSTPPWKNTVTCTPGTAGAEIQGAVDALGSSFHVDVIADQVD